MIKFRNIAYSVLAIAAFVISSGPVHGAAFDKFVTYDQNTGKVNTPANAIFISANGLVTTNGTNTVTITGTNATIRLAGNNQTITLTGTGSVVLSNTNSALTVTGTANVGTLIATSGTAGKFTVLGNASTSGTSTLGTAGTPVTFLRHGTATVASGTVVVSDTNVTTGTEIYISRSGTSGTITSPITATIISGTNFTITTGNGSDAGVVNYLMIKP